MFLIIRNINGLTETLKNSGTHLDKTFTDFHTANKFVQQLNQKITPSMQWGVSEKLKVND
jgi:hypothetical protein